MTLLRNQPGIRRAAILGVLLSWIGRLCSLSVSFVLTPYLVRKLGDEQFGIWSILATLTSYYALLDLGISGATQKYIAQHHARGDVEAVNRVVASSWVLYAMLSGFVLIAATVTAFFFPEVFPVQTIPSRVLRIVVILTAITVVLRLLAQVFDAALVAMLRYDLHTAASVGQQVGQAFAMVVVLQSGGGLLELSAAVLAVTVIGRIIRIFTARSIMRDVHCRWRYFDRATFKRLFSFGATFAPSMAARKVVDRLGGVVVGLFMGPAAVTYYAIAESLTTKSLELGQGVVAVVGPMASRLEAEQRFADLQMLMTTSSRLLLAWALGCAVLLTLLGRTFLALWIGDAFVPTTYPVLCVLSIGLTARMSSEPLRSALRGTAMLGGLFKASIAELVLTAILALLLVPIWGQVGMAAAAAAGQIASGAVLLPYFAAHVAQLSFSRFVVQIWPRPFMCGGLILGASLPVVQGFLGPSWPRIAGVGGWIIMVTIISSFLLCLNRSQRKDIGEILLGRLRRSRLGIRTQVARLHGGEKAAHSITVTETSNNTNS